MDGEGQITRVGGDLGVGRHVAVGGDVVVQGDALIKGDARIEGWLDAENVIGPNKGLFPTYEDLVARYPKPREGWWAIVGKTSNGKTYYVIDGAWVASGENDGSVDSAVEASHAKEADHSVEADNADKWDGEHFGEWIDQPVRSSDDVKFGSVQTNKFAEGVSGAKIDADGNAEFESIVSRSYLKIQELIYNRLNALEGNTSFADSGTIESITNNTDGTVTAVIRKRWETDFISFQIGDIVYGYVNNVHNEITKEWYRCWGVIKKLDRDANSITLTMYSDDNVPGISNRAFTEGMLISRWGNVIEPNQDTYLNSDYSSFIVLKNGKYINQRQRSFMISSDNGRIVELIGVRSPILSAENYGTVLGQIPDGILPDGIKQLINYEQPYLYARGIIVQDLIRIGYEGVTVRTANYRGLWNAETAASLTDYYRTTNSVYDTVTWRNALWQCIMSRSTEEPSENSSAWAKITAMDSDAAESKVWTIVPNENVISIRADGNKPEKLTCTVTLVSSRTGTRSITSKNELASEGVSLFFSIDGGTTWEEYIFGSDEPLETESGESLEIEVNGTAITIGGNDIATSEIGERIIFSIKDTESDAVLHQVVVPVVRDGINGKDGQQGLPGREGLLVYPAGVYDSSKTYTATGDTCPVVEYGGQYYRLKSGATWTVTENSGLRVNPAIDVAMNDEQTVWLLFDKFQSIFTDVIMAEFAKLASAVFYGDFMISQQGVTKPGNEASTDYEKFKTGNFVPNVQINFNKGYIKALKGEFAGDIVTKFKALRDSDFVNDLSFKLNGEIYTKVYNMATNASVLKLSYNSDGVIVLPGSMNDVGARVIICSTSADYTNRPSLKIVSADGYYISGAKNADGGNPRRINLFDGVVELMYCPTEKEGVTGKWVIMSAYGTDLSYT